ncbi:hypothetical protein [Ensifer sp. WSM1721]|uniref:hypothetical protein n=1 Tax=Ensifer sp. WSM1721 TaxID=1041159 RepID=UPI00047E8DE2|nr:hypothetical protein [Ensifer sp. WSM1721]
MEPLVARRLPTAIYNCFHCWAGRGLGGAISALAAAKPGDEMIDSATAKSHRAVAMSALPYR